MFAISVGKEGKIPRINPIHTTKVLKTNINVILVGFKLSLLSKKPGKINETIVMINKRKIRDTKKPP